MIKRVVFAFVADVSEMFGFHNALFPKTGIGRIVERILTSNNTISCSTGVLPAGGDKKGFRTFTAA